VPPLLFITSATSVCDQSPQVPDQFLTAGRQHTAHRKGLHAVLDRAANLDGHLGFDASALDQLGQARTVNGGHVGPSPEKKNQISFQTILPSMDNGGLS
jgi:hypothetical protein